MASSGTKKGKTKWKTIETSSIINPNVSRKTTSSWADESPNDLDDTYDYGRKAEVNLPTAPRSARAPELDANIPKEPPFQAYLSNLSYDVTEEDLANFFSELKVKNVRLPKDDRGNTMRAKGFGYVEFEDRNSLIEALSMPDLTCKNRRMRIEVAEGGEGGRGGRGGPRDRPNEPDRTLGDWRSGPRPEADDGYRSAGGPRGGVGFDRDRRGFRDDDRDKGGFRSRDGGSGMGFRDRGFRDERGPGGGGSFRDGGGGGSFRDGGDRYDDRRRGFDDRDRRDFGGDRDRRDDRREFGGDRGTWRRDPEPDKREPEPEKTGEPKTRTRLNLQPRSRPLEEKESPAPAPAVPVPSSASIFGGARPVDTAAREREIEERLARQTEGKAPVTGLSMQSAPEPAPAHTPAPADPAPPPKENVWARRSQTKEVEEGEEEEVEGGCQEEQALAQ